MMCLLTRTTMPHIPFTPFGREIASLSSIRQFRLLPFGLLQCLGRPNIAPAFSWAIVNKPPCHLLMLQDVTPAHKGLTPSGLSLISKLLKNFYYIYHSRRTHRLTKPCGFQRFASALHVGSGFASGHWRTPQTRTVGSCKRWAASLNDRSRDKFVS